MNKKKLLESMKERLKKQTISENFFDMRSFPKNYNIFIIKSLLVWLCINIGLIIIFAIIYYYYDTGYKSKFEGLSNGKREFYEYLYLSGMIGTLVGFGDILAKRNPLTKFIVISHVITSLFCNYAFFSFKELKLADDPGDTHGYIHSNMKLN
jgi:hypothetical protein